MAEDRNLVDRLRRGDAEAFDILYQKYIQKIYAFTLKTAKSSKLAEDVVHDVFVKIWKTRDSLDPDRSFQSYLFTIARNHLLNLLQRSMRENRILEEICNSTKTSAEETADYLDYKESRKIILEAIEELPPRRKIIFRLCRLNGLTYEEAARHLEISYHTVNKHMVKALKSIREHIEEKNRILPLIGVPILLYGLLRLLN